MKIARFAERTQLSPYTLRYYETLGLLRIARDTSGHRQFNEKDIEWVKFITRLKETGMPLAQICVYAALREKGAVTLSQRRQMLAEHQAVLQAHIAQAQAHLQALDNKIAFYDEALREQVAHQNAQV